ncbi:MAG: aldehyde:ferredoxin oxidoreductase, partial [Planctomycetota bacterium]
MASELCGYHGRYLLIDLSQRRCFRRPLRVDVLRRYVGGVGLGTWLLMQHTPPRCTPENPDAPLAVAFSPLVGTPLTTSAKLAVLCPSPLTGRLNDALASSHFALAGKRTGHDAFVLRGRASRPSVVLIEPSGIRLEDAGDLLGLSSAETEAAVRDRWGSEWQVAAIGLAGENGVRYATLSHDGRHAGRGGTGTFLGAKNVKAIAVRGDARTPLFDRGAVLRLSRELSARSLGDATAKYRELGTVSNLVTFNRLGVLPTAGFQRTTFA